MRRTRTSTWSTMALVLGAAFALGASPSPSGTTLDPFASSVPMTPNGLLLWPAPPEPLERTVAAGLTPERVESMAFHVHAGLLIYLDGTAIAVPAGIGIDTSNSDVAAFPDPEGIGYGTRGCEVPCISPLHTHGWWGVLHTESNTPVPNRLGQFFTEWGVRLDSTCVGQFCSPDTPIAIEVDGVAFAGDPRTIELADQRLIVVLIGTRPEVVPSTFDFSRP